MESIDHFAHFMITTRDVPLIFFPGPIDADMTVPFEMHILVDSAECDHHESGTIQISWLIKGGPFWAS